MGFKSNWERFWTERVTKDKKIGCIFIVYAYINGRRKKCENTKMEHKTNEDKENKEKDI